MKADNEKDICFIRIKKCTSFLIRKWNEGFGDVVFDGSINGNNTINFGIKAIPENESNLDNITIREIVFQNFLNSGIKIRGWSGTNQVKAENILIEKCSIDHCYGKGIFIQIARYIEIKDCNVTQETSVTNNNYKNDGIFLNEGVDSVLIENNYIKVLNDYTSDHIDGIQITGTGENPVLVTSSNLHIRRNVIVNNSNHSNRDGIIIDGTYGNIEVSNNNIFMQSEKNLINIHFFENTSNILIYNNTLVSGNDPDHLLYLLNNQTTTTNWSRLKIFNNIFYKTNGTDVSSKYVIYFAGFQHASTNFNSEILDYNLYFYGPCSTCTPKIHFSDGWFPWQTSLWETHGHKKDPLFNIINNELYTLSQNSNAKNKGKVISLVDKDIQGNKRPYWEGGVDLGAYELDEAQIRLGYLNSSNTGSITHNITAIGTYWAKGANPWPITTNQNIANSSYESFATNANVDIETWNGLHLLWVRNNETDAAFGYGFYKIETEDGNHHFYLDYRDANISYNPNIYVQYYEDGQFNRYQIYTNNTFQNIPDGSILRIWEIADQTNQTPIVSTDNLADYYSHMLIPLSKNNHPRLVWGPGSSTNVHSLQRKITGEKFANLFDNPNVFEHLDEDINLTIPPDPYFYSWQYRVVSLQDKYSNEESFEGTWNLQKNNKLEIKNLTYELNQNYPNPFNPTTTISFSIPKVEHVTIKLYNILGKEVMTLMNNQLEPGIYTKELNANTLSSGIYFYRMSAGTFTIVKKMQILK